MIFRSFIGVLKNIFSKGKDFSVFGYQLISDAGEGIYRALIGGFQGRCRGVSLCCSNKDPRNTLSGPCPGPFSKPRGFSKKQDLFFRTPMKLRKTAFSQAHICNRSYGWLFWSLSNYKIDMHGVRGGPISSYEPTDSFGLQLCFALFSKNQGQLII